jgi:restriction system protein
MAQRIKLPLRNEYYVAAIHSLKTRGGSATIEEMEEDVADELKLSEKARAIPHGDGRRTQFQYELAWVRTYLKWAKALENSERGVWHLTPTGRSMSDEELRGVWKRIVADQRRRRKVKPAERLPEDEQHQIPNISWKEKLLKILLELDPKAFERLCQRLLRESGFIKVEITGRSGDGGIDGVGVLRLNLLSFHVLFQCKRWRGSVGPSTIRDFRGAMVGRADKGLVLTTGNFTPEARKEATRDGAPPIDLVDGESLCDLLKSTKIGVTITLIEDVSLDEQAFAAV